MPTTSKNVPTIALYDKTIPQNDNGVNNYLQSTTRSDGFGEEGSKLVAEIASREGITLSKAEEMVKNAYLAGFSNVDSSKVSFETDTQIDAFTAGKKDRVMQDIANEERAKKAAVYDGVFTESEFTKSFTDADRKMISTVAKSFGMDVSVVDKIIANQFTGAEANAEHQDGKMRISSTAEKLIYELVMHEGGHRMKQLAPTEFGVLMDALYERSTRENTKSGRFQTAAFDNVKGEYDNAGLTMDTSGYMEEFAVRELETIFSSAEEFNKWYAELSGNVQVKTAWQKFMDFVSKLIEDVKSVISQTKMSKEERAEAKKSLAELERIKKFYAETYKAAEDAVQNRANTQSFETNSAGNIEINIDKGYNGNTNHSLKSKYNEYNTIGMQWAYDSSTEIGDRKVLYNPHTKRYVLVEATKKDVGFIELNTGAYKQLREDVEIYESKKQRNINSDVHRFGTGQNDNARNNVNAGNRRKGKQNVEVYEGKSVSNRAADTQTTDGNLKEDKSFSLKGGLSDTEIRNAIDNNELSKYVDEGKISDERYNELTKIYGAIPKGEKPHRDVSVPKKTAKDKKVSQTVRTILEAKATPDEAVPTIEELVAKGEFSYDVYTDQEAIAEAEKSIKKKGWEAAKDIIDEFDFAYDRAKFSERLDENAVVTLNIIDCRQIPVYKCIPEL